MKAYLLTEQSFERVHQTPKHPTGFRSRGIHDGHSGHPYQHPVNRISVGANRICREDLLAGPW